MKILVLSRGVVGREMASPGVRAFHMARVLAEQLPEAEVTLSVPNVSDISSPHPRLRITPYRNALAGFLQMLRHDIIISRNFPLHAAALHPGKVLVLDFYAAFYSEWLALSRRLPQQAPRKLWMAARRHLVDLQLTMADYVVCSNERQRDLWVGALAGLGLVTPNVFERDASLRRLVDVIPYGVRSGRPGGARRVLKGVVPGIGDDDKVLIWNGSVMEWFDAPTVIRAMALVSRVRNDVKLFFLGTEHPDKVTGLRYGPLLQAVQLSKELGLYGRSVFFNEGWVPYDETGDYLAEADLGVCAGFDNLEAHFAFRTRFVDLFWAELPIVCTRGDELAERVERGPLGIAVPPEDPDAFAAGVLRLLDDGELYARCRSNVAVLKEELSWERVMAPLVEFCRTGRSIAAPKRQRMSALARRTIAHATINAYYLTAYRLMGRREQVETL
ncbi:MAG: glycosyltransferase [Chloroflexi bacterium]|nr:glycosyltransferase [Chloroflexota bacterium]